ncbi:MAG: carboxy-S-adenosyl-L-methionine synthase CmoA [Spirochaetales bacterium]|nr:carboxy-S-adenosyl-L-methionine synthase CmoA [Spirochaetales bacterium]
MSQERVDRVFHGDGEVKPFEFNENVAHVFDDMAERSIPWYREVQRMVTTLGVTFFKPGSRIYDLGCSTGTTMALLAQAFEERGVDDYRLMGVDNSEPMCREAREKLGKSPASPDRWTVDCNDLESYPIENASVVVMNYTLQFVDPLAREELMGKIYRGLNHNGVLLISDKTQQSHTDTSRIFMDNYYHMKRQNGYSEMEISRKREALENVLIPYTVEEEKELFRQSGFEAVDLFFTWFNFSSFICMKKG